MFKKRRNFSGAAAFLQCIFISLWFDFSPAEDFLNANAELAGISQDVTSQDVTVAVSLTFI